MSRSHRHRVPTARPPAHALGVVYVWGRGASTDALQTYLRREDVAVDDRDDVARKLAIDHGCPLGIVNDAWAWRLDRADPHTIDALTRDDPAVMGWTADRLERCAPSVALRGALSVLSPDEIIAAADELESRFGRPDRLHPQNDSTQWIARDNRIVRFDRERGEWLLDDFVAT